MRLRTILIFVVINLTRPRAAKDYHYILANTTTQGANEPVQYTTRMKAGECVGLTSSSFPEYEQEYAEINKMRSAFNKQLALDDKLEKIKVELQTIVIFVVFTLLT